MIDRKSVITSAALAEHLATKGFYIASKPNTPLAELTNIAEYMSFGSQIGLPSGSPNKTLTDDINQNDYLMELATYYENVTFGGPDSPSKNDISFDAYIESISKHVKAHVAFAKNVVKPVIMDYAEKVTEALNAQPKLSPYADFCIDPVDLPGVLFEKSFYNTLKLYKGKVPLKPKEPLNLDSKTLEEILELMSTGDQSLDDLVKLFALQFNEKEPNILVDIYENFFRPVDHGTVVNKVITYDTLLGANIFDKANIALVLYLISQRLFNSVDESARGMSINDYTNRVAEIRDFAGTLLYQAVDQAENFQKSGMIIVETNPGRKSCKVYEPNYQKWLDNGGSPEIIFGVLLSGRRSYSEATINTFIDEIKKSWESYVTFYTTSEANLQFERFIRTLKHCYADIMTDFSEEEMEYINFDSNFLDKAQVIFNKEVDHIKMFDIDDIYGIATKLICRSRFFYTDAESILTDINEAKKINPNIKDVREASLIATIHYVVDYIADQMVLRRA